MKLHVMNEIDNEFIAEIDETKYRELLMTKTGKELAKAITDLYVVVNKDPRHSELDATDCFFCYTDVVSGNTTADDLLEQADWHSPWMD